MNWLQEEEYYVCIYSHRYADTILFHHEGGVDIGDVDNKVRQPSSRSYLQFGAEQLAVKTQLPIFTQSSIPTKQEEQKWNDIWLLPLLHGVGGLLMSGFNNYIPTLSCVLTL